MEETAKQPQPQRKDIPESRKIASLYIAFFGSIFLATLPSLYTAMLSLIFFSLTLMTLYKTRRHEDEDGPSATHAHFLIRTFWNSNIILLISIVLSILYFLMFVRLSSVNPCISAILSHAEYLVMHATPKNLLAHIIPCRKPFIEQNKTVMQITGFIAFSPVLLYLLIRFIRGWPKAIKNRSI